MNADRKAVTFLGMGEMGRSLAAAALSNGYEVSIWNRTPGRAGGLPAAGAIELHDLERDLPKFGPIVVCLYDHSSVASVLQAISNRLSGRTVINMTTTTPDEARDLAVSSHGAGLAYLDGVIMATPKMIGTPDAQILFSGPADICQAQQNLLATWGSVSYEGEDAGLASVVDLALLSSMYAMITGFVHGAAMMRASGRSAAEFSERASIFLAAMTEALPESGRIIDGEVSQVPAQSQAWTLPVLDTIARASLEQGINPAPVNTVRALVRERIDSGFGAEPFERIGDAMISLRENT